MAPTSAMKPTNQPDANGESGEKPAKRTGRRRVLKIVGWGAVGVIVLLAAGIAWFILGRDQAGELETEDALAGFREANETNTSPEEKALEENETNLPAAGVYQATASGTESIGLVGFDETFGPSSPVTVTHNDSGCYTWRTDFNSHHWRSWTFCPTENAGFELTQIESFTARKAPGFEIASLVTYDCEKQPTEYFWPNPQSGDTRTGACTGTSDHDDSITDDAVKVEILDVSEKTIGGETLEVVHLRTKETFTRDQNGEEIAEWWIDLETGLPVKLTIDSNLSGVTNYTETAELELTSLTPAT